MFHLLVSHGGWDERGGTLSTSRVYIRNDVEHEQRFLKADGRRLNVEMVRGVPALLMAETGSDDIQQARVAHITNIQQNDRDTIIQYTVDPNIPPIRNQELEQYYSQFGSGNFGFSHTCWRVIDDDLYKIILSSMQRNPQRPTVFSVNYRFNFTGRHSGNRAFPASTHAVRVGNVVMVLLIFLFGMRW